MHHIVAISLFPIKSLVCALVISTTYDSFYLFLVLISCLSYHF